MKRADWQSSKCIGIGIEGARVWSSRSIANLLQSPRLLLDCSVSRNHQVNCCLEKFNCVFSEIQLATNTSNLAIYQISFKGVDGSVRSLGKCSTSDVELSFPLSHNLVW